MNLRIALASLLSFLLGAALFAAKPTIGVIAKDLPTETQDNRAADVAAIRAHIESICQAFIDGDVDKIYATHSEDWRGILPGARVPIKGINEYMKYYGFTWPRPTNAPKPVPNPNAAASGFKVYDFDAHFYGPELAVACFMLDSIRKSGDGLVTTNRLRLMDVYAKRKGSWIQVASHTVIDPEWRQEQMSQPMTVTPQMREQILKVREAVWRAYFANDRATLNRLIPEEAIAIDNGATEWSDRARILAGAQGFAESGGKLVRLEFPKTEMQVYGDTVIVYTTYLCEIEMNGQRMTQSGRGTEIFVWRGNELVNTGWHLDTGK